MELLLKDHRLFSDIYLEPSVLQSCLLATSVVESSSYDFFKIEVYIFKVIDHDFSLYSEATLC